MALDERMNDEFQAIGGMRIGRGKQSTWRKPTVSDTFSTKNPT
jgi:hypothetical protein